MEGLQHRCINLVDRNIIVKNGKSINGKQRYKCKHCGCTPFGMKFLNVNSYRYGYQGEYAEDETGEEILANSFQLRLYNPRLGRWMSPDPKEEFHSPYLAMGNNPILKIDPDGGNTETTVVTANDDGTYTVVDWIDDKKTDVVLEDGTKIGKSLTTHSFVGEDGNAIKGTIIDLFDNSGQLFFDNELKGGAVGILHYINNAKGGEIYDFKTRGLNDRPKDQSLNQYVYRGMTFQGKIASARDVGNYGAGAVAGYHGLTWSRARLGFDGLQKWQDLDLFSVEVIPTQKAQLEGHKLTYPLYLERKAEKDFQKAKDAPFYQMPSKY